MHEDKMKQQLAEAFGDEHGHLNAKQLWALANFAKHVRLRARNNAAFNNLCNRLFPNARFQQVQKTRISYRTKLPETYPGLRILVKNAAGEYIIDEAAEQTDGEASDE